ncbi:MAG: zinc-binding dehydrogenase, partial [Pseudomonadales bacterium]|nr:zinc-binding dehydrogenase [Pseudomonadales bacterium]
YFLIRNKRSNVFLVDSNTKDLDTLSQYMGERKVFPVIDSEYPLEEIDQAYERSKTGRAVGKIIINVRGTK